jgi:hypothetical protein
MWWRERDVLGKVAFVLGFCVSCIYVCMYVCMYVCVCKSTYSGRSLLCWGFVCVVYVCMHVCVCMCLCMYMYMHASWPCNKVKYVNIYMQHGLATRSNTQHLPATCWSKPLQQGQIYEHLPAAWSCNKVKYINIHLQHVGQSLCNCELKPIVLLL